MRRKAFDIIVSVGGLLVAAVLLIASGLLFWGHSFVQDNVHSQLAAQKIFMPTAGSSALNDPQVKPFLTKYAGQQVVNGAQAKAFADHYIRVHLAEATGGRTYSELSAAARTDPNNTQLQGLVQTSFRGETLRGLLLNAYAFWKMGQIALYAAWIGLWAGVALVGLAVLGLFHARRTPIDMPTHVPGWHPEHTTTS